MPIQRIPSFWDYLGQGIDQFSEQRKNERDRKLQTALSLFAAGSTDSATLQSALQAAGIKGMPVMPSQAERRNKILSAPPTDLGQMPSGIPPVGVVPQQPVRASMPRANTISDTEAEAAGLTTPTARRTQIASMKTSEAEAAAKPGELAIKRQGETDKQFQEAGTRFVSKEIDPTTVTASQRQKAVEAAFAKYKAMRQVSAIGAIPDEAYARAFFDQAFSDALVAKRHMDIQEKAASYGRISPEDRDFVAVGQQLERVRKAIDDVKSSEQLSFYIGKPLAEVPEFARGELDRYYRLLEVEKSLAQAQAKVSNPTIRKEMGDAASAMGRSAAGSPSPSARQQGSTEASNLVARMADRILGGAATLADARAEIGKHITADQYKMIEQQVSEETTKRKKARGGT